MGTGRRRQYPPSRKVKVNPETTVAERALREVGELASGKASLDGIGMINAQLEDTESLLALLRGHLLALETSPSPGSLSGSGPCAAQEQGSVLPAEPGRGDEECGGCARCYYREVAGAR
jgi:hypothetical protein